MLALLALLAASVVVEAQFRRRGGGGGGFPRGFGVRVAKPEDFVGGFQFCRVAYNSDFRGDGGNWSVDYPRADINLSIRLSELTRSYVSMDSAGEPIPLTRVEFRLLQTILEADGRVLTRDQLLDAVYGRDQADVLDRTIDVHIGRLRDKLGDDAEVPRYVATVRGIGYRAAPS